MPPRKRSRQLAFRTGQINAAGGRPIDPRTIKHRSVVAAAWVTSATTAGDHMTFRVNNFNTPLEMANSLSFTTWSGVSDDRHPSGHAELTADGYDTYRVLSTHYRFSVNFMGTTSEPTEDYVFAYKFDASSQVAVPAMPATIATGEMWLDLQASPGWVWRRFSKGFGNNHPYKAGGVINIDVPNVYKLVSTLRKGMKIQILTALTVIKKDLWYSMSSQLTTVEYLEIRRRRRLRSVYYT